MTTAATDTPVFFLLNIHPERLLLFPIHYTPHSPSSTPSILLYVCLRLRECVRECLYVNNSRFQFLFVYFLKNTNKRKKQQNDGWLVFLLSISARFLYFTHKFSYQNNWSNVDLYNPVEVAFPVQQFLLSGLFIDEQHFSLSKNNNTSWLFLSK